MNVIGHGAYGKVFKAKHYAGDQVFALKAINKDILIEEDELASVALEKEILSHGKKVRSLMALIDLFMFVACFLLMKYPESKFSY